jgi:hypothetical protein
MAGRPIHCSQCDTTNDEPLVMAIYHGMMVWLCRVCFVEGGRP